MKKQTKIILIGIISIILISTAIFIIITNSKSDDKKENNDKQEENSITYNMKKDSETNELVFFKNETETSRYKCQYEECDFSMYGSNAEITYFDRKNGIALITDGRTKDENTNRYYHNKMIIYSFEKGILNEYNNIIVTTDLGRDENFIPYYLVMLNTNNESALLDLNGNILKDFEENQFMFKSYEGLYIDSASFNIEKNIIITLKNNKYGIEKINSNDTIIEHKFDNIKLDEGITTQYKDLNDRIYNYGEKLYSENNYFKAKENDKWYLYNYETKEKIIKTGYDELFIIDKDLILVIDNEIVSIRDFNDNKLTDDTIKITKNLKGMMTTIPDGISITKNDLTNKIDIYILDEASYDNNGIINNPISYEYNISEKTLTKKDLEQ